MPKALKPGEDTVIVSFSVPPAIRAWYVKASEEHGITMSAIMRGAVRRFNQDPDPKKWEDCK